MDILKYIKAGQFTHVLVSLELLLSNGSTISLLSPLFAYIFSLVIINKYYLVTN